MNRLQGRRHRQTWSSPLRKTSIAIPVENEEGNSPPKSKQISISTAGQGIVTHLLHVVAYETQSEDYMDFDNNMPKIRRKWNKLPNLPVLKQVGSSDSINNEEKLQFLRDVIDRSETQRENKKRRESEISRTPQRKPTSHKASAPTDNTKTNVQHSKEQTTTNYRYSHPPEQIQSPLMTRPAIKRAESPKEIRPMIGNPEYGLSPLAAPTQFRAYYNEKNEYVIEEFKLQPPRQTISPDKSGGKITYLRKSEEMKKGVSGFVTFPLPENVLDTLFPPSMNGTHRISR